MAYKALLSLHSTIETFLNPPYSNLVPAPESESFYQEVYYLKAFLVTEMTTAQNNKDRATALKGQIMEVVTKFKDGLESHKIKYLSIKDFEYGFRSMFSQDLEKVKQEMVDFVETIKKIKEDYNAKDLETSNASPLADLENMVGLDDELKKLKYRLLKGSRSLIFVSVVGMAGIGKTTLLKALYNDPLISDYCYPRAFVKVGPEYNLKDILLDILVQINSNVDKIFSDDDHLKLNIFSILKERRYLIVLDNVWDIDVWDEIGKLFPNDGNGSRIIMTTRLNKIAREFSSEIYEVPFLNEEKCWNLFCKKVFVPPELEKVGKKIVKNCGGLPLAIISVANLLSKKEKTLQYWEEIAENENILAIRDTPISNVLSLSYKYLPQHLKECFLYIGVFPLNHEISVSKLVKLWVAEGLIKPDRFKTFENTAEEYLEDLVSKNIVFIGPRSSSGRIKTCSAHYFFWHLCIREAEKDNFFHLINSYLSVFSKSMHRQRRLCFHRNTLLGLKDVSRSIKSVSNVCSILCTGPDHPIPISLKLTSLNVLDALTICFYNFPIEILESVELRYLACSYNGKLPSSISRLQNLLYLIVNRYLNINSSGGAPSYMPIEIWEMQKLRHLQVMGSDLPDPPVGAHLTNLLSLLGVSARSCTKEVLERIPKLEKLGVQIVLPHDVDETLHLFDHLALLPRLKSFKCVVSNPNLMSQSLLFPDSLLTFPLSLIRLTLNGCGFSWKKMSFIGALPNLKVLKLRCYAFQGPEWETDVGEFPKLEYLLLEDTDLVEWKVKDCCFPSLECLIIRQCNKLKEIPCVLGDIVTLQKIELVDCSPSTMASVKQIQKEQRPREYGSEELQVQVYSIWDNEKPFSKSENGNRIDEN